MAPPAVQIFGIKGSQSTRAAERFFKDRGISFHFVDLEERPMSKGEVRHWLERFGLGELIDTSGKPYVATGLQYLKLSEAEWLTRIEGEPRLLRLPLVRSGKLLTIGKNEEGWKGLLQRS